jgi:hypothetical protein
MRGSVCASNRLTLQKWGTDLDKWQHYGDQYFEPPRRVGVRALFYAPGLRSRVQFGHCLGTGPRDGMKT